MLNEKIVSSIIAPVTVQGKEKSAQAQPELLYFSCPKALQQDETYSTVLSVLRRKHPDARILAPKEIWGTMPYREWRRTYRQQLATVTHYYLVADLDGYVGHACYEEWLYFRARGIQAWAFLPGFLGIVPVGKLLVDGQSYRQYARVLPVAGKAGE